MRGFIVPHTHWDREWYLTFQQFRFKLVRLVDQVLEILESNPEFKHFTLDGQAVVLEDYLKIKPQERRRIESLVRAGRLLIGPWYVLPDEFLVSGESLLRNLERGLRSCADFGGAMQVGYVPDQFGHIGQLPQVLQGCGIDAAVLWRGVGGACGSDHFRWEAPDGSAVTCIYLADSYSNAAGLPQTAEELAQRVEQMVEAQRGFLSSESILLMNGSDHLFPQPHLPGILEQAGRAQKIELKISTLPAFIAAVREAAPETPTLVGELRSGERAPLLVSCASSRMLQKQRNHVVETLLEKYAEPLAAWAWLHGAPYPSGFLAESWRQLLLNHPHDSICGCSNDQVHREIETRFDQAEQLAVLVKEESLKHLSQQIDSAWFAGDAGLIVFNPHPRPLTGLVEVVLPDLGEKETRAVIDQDGRSAPWQAAGGGSEEYFSINLTSLQARAALGWVSGREFQGLHLNGVKLAGPVDGELKVDFIMGISPVGELDLDQLKKSALELFKDKSIKRIRVVARQGGERGLFMAADVPACGWRSFEPVSAAADAAASDLKISRAGMENRFYRITFNPDGTFDLLEKENGLSLKKQHRLVDGGDKGDLYTFTAPEVDLLLDLPARGLKLRRVKIEVLERGPVRVMARLIRVYRLPLSLTPERNGRSKKKIAYRINTTISLILDSPGVHFQTTVDNRVHDHRLRVHFSAPFATETAWVDGHFQVVRRPIQPAPGEYSTWAEKPCGLAPQKTFVSIDDGAYGLSVINHGLPEYEVLPGRGGASTEIALTLLRCVGWLSREDLLNRPGHAGPVVETPEGQCPGEHTFRYSLVPHRGSWREAGIKALAEQLTAPLLGLASGRKEGALPASGAMLSLEPKELVLSCVKQSEADDVLLARFFNCSDRSLEAVITPGFTYKQIAPADLLGFPVKRQFTLEKGAVRLTAHPWEIITLRFKR